MKNFLAILTILAIIPCLGISQTKWEEGTLKDALVKAKTLDAKIFVDFYTTWCGACKKLDKELFQKKAGSRLSESLLCLRFDAEKGEGESLAKKFSVISFPTAIILDKEGKEIDRVISYEDQSSFLKTVIEYSQGKSGLNVLEEKLKTSPDNISILFAAGEKYAYRGDEAKANQYLGKVFELDPKNRKGRSDEALYTLGRILYHLILENYPKALSIYLELENNFPESKYAKLTDLQRARIHMKSEEKTQAKKALDNYLLKNKTDVRAEAYYDYASFCLDNDLAIEEGLKVAKDGLLLNPRSDDLYDVLAQIYNRQGDHDKAVNSIRKALELKPQSEYYKEQLDKFLKSRDLKKAK